MKRKKTVALKQMFPGADYDCVSDSYPSVERVCQHWSRHLFCVNHIFSTVWVTRVSVLIGEQLCSARPLIVLKLLHEPLSVCVICTSGDILFVFVWTSVSYRERVYIYVSKFNLECVCVCISIAHLQEKKTQVWLTWGSRLTLSPFFFLKTIKMFISKWDMGDVTFSFSPVLFVSQPSSPLDSSLFRFCGDVVAVPSEFFFFFKLLGLALKKRHYFFKC